MPYRLFMAIALVLAVLSFDLIASQPTPPTLPGMGGGDSAAGGPGPMGDGGPMGGGGPVGGGGPGGDGGGGGDGPFDIAQAAPPTPFPFSGARNARYDERADRRGVGSSPYGQYQSPYGQFAVQPQANQRPTAANAGYGGYSSYGAGAGGLARRAPPQMSIQQLGGGGGAMNFPLGAAYGGGGANEVPNAYAGFGGNDAAGGAGGGGFGAGGYGGTAAPAGGGFQSGFTRGVGAGMGGFPAGGGGFGGMMGGGAALGGGGIGGGGGGGGGYSFDQLLNANNAGNLNFGGGDAAGAGGGGGGGGGFGPPMPPRFGGPGGGGGGGGAGMSAFQAPDTPTTTFRRSFPIDADLNGVGDLLSGIGSGLSRMGATHSYADTYVPTNQGQLARSASNSLYAPSTLPPIIRETQYERRQPISEQQANSLGDVAA